MTGESIFKITEDIVALESIMERLEVQDVEEVCSLAARDLDGFLTHVGPKSEIESLLAEKVDGYVGYFRHLEARANARTEEAQHLSKLARHDLNKMNRLKENIKSVADRLGRPKLEGNTRSITVSTSKRPAIILVDEEAVPMEFKERVPEHYKIVKANIAKHITETGEVPAGIETRSVVTVKFR